MYTKIYEEWSPPRSSKCGGQMESSVEAEKTLGQYQGWRAQDEALLKAESTGSSSKWKQDESETSEQLVSPQKEVLGVVFPAGNATKEMTFNPNLSSRPAQVCTLQSGRKSDIRTKVKALEHSASRAAGTEML
ncbi:hypothetical protein H920_04791 [Fukomys damarensis]|uniref:Uncharacterized protein n=1 Tax=Fukomys damarensis TaxID=885580 RepID=A0A091DRT9_FUKDA|nr:hypothetical protein H920_04791 [Fukomys damarensis]